MSERLPGKKDLVVVAADKHMEYALRSVLHRHQSLRIRPVSSQVLSYGSGLDPGCYGKSHEFLGVFRRDFEHALVIFDHEGSGQESRDVEEVEKEVGEHLRRSGWGDKAAAVVITPELEVWVWSDSPQVDQVLGWRRRKIGLRDWLHGEGLWPPEKPKPPDPKLAMERTLYHLGRPRSSALYAELAKRVSFQRCRDRSFCRLVQILRSWFPPVKPHD